MGSFSSTLAREACRVKGPQQGLMVDADANFNKLARCSLGRASSIRPCEQAATGLLIQS
jgi:hypothetical protein